MANYLTSTVNNNNPNNNPPSKSSNLRKAWSFLAIILVAVASFTVFYDLYLTRRESFRGAWFVRTNILALWCSLVGAFGYNFFRQRATINEIPPIVSVQWVKFRWYVVLAGFLGLTSIPFYFLLNPGYNRLFYPLNWLIQMNIMLLFMTLLMDLFFRQVAASVQEQPQSQQISYVPVGQVNTQKKSVFESKHFNYAR